MFASRTLAVTLAVISFAMPLHAQTAGGGGADELRSVLLESKDKNRGVAIYTNGVWSTRSWCRSTTSTWSRRASSRAGSSSGWIASTGCPLSSDGEALRAGVRPQPRADTRGVDGCFRGSPARPRDRQRHRPARRPFRGGHAAPRLAGDGSRREPAGHPNVARRGSSAEYALAAGARRQRRMADGRCDHAALRRCVHREHAAHHGLGRPRSTVRAPAVGGRRNGNARRSTVPSNMRVATRATATTPSTRAFARKTRSRESATRKPWTRSRATRLHARRRSRDARQQPHARVSLDRYCSRCAPPLLQPPEDRTRAPARCPSTPRRRCRARSSSASGACGRRRRPRTGCGRLASAACPPAAAAGAFLRARS